jgi:hypothetical protein
MLKQGEFLLEVCMPHGAWRMAERSDRPMEAHKNFKSKLLLLQHGFSSRFKS